MQGTELDEFNRQVSLVSATVAAVCTIGDWIRTAVAATDTISRPDMRVSTGSDNRKAEAGELVHA